jgi:hypothetical protein
MTQYLYSPTTRGFYLPEIHGDTIPGDAAPVTDEERAAILGTVTPGQPAPVTVVSMRQARLALLAAGLLDDANAAVAAAGQAAQIEWEFSNEVRRDNALIAALAGPLGLDDAALDALFEQAATL